MDTPRPSLQTQIARAVADATFAQGLTQLALAEKSGIAQATLSRKLRGIAPFNVAELDAISAALGIPVSDLMEGVAA